jgi:hypothetical protein
MHNSLNVVKTACCSHLSGIVLTFSGVEFMGYCTESTVAWFLGHTRKRTSLHPWLSPRGILRLFQAPLQSPSRSRGGTNLAQCDECSDSLPECSERTQMKIPNMFATSRIAILLFTWTSSLDQYFRLFCFSMDVLSVRHFEQGSRHFWTRKTTQKPVFFPLSVSKTCFQHFECLRSMFPQFKVKFGADTRSSFKSVIFWVRRNRKCNNTCLYLTSYCSTTTRVITVVLAHTGLVR